MKSSLLITAAMLAGMAGAQTYCIPQATGMSCAFSDEYIANVTVSNLNNNSLCPTIPAYEDFTGSVAAVALTPGQTYPISVTVGNAWGTDRVYVMLDVNGDGLWQTTGGELLATLGPVASGSGATPQTLTGNIAIPATALATSRLRLRLSYGVLPAGNEGCANAVFGNCEDYTAALATGPVTPEYQINQPNATMTLDGVSGSAFSAAQVMRCVNAPVAVNLASPLTGSPFDVLLSTIPLVPVSGGALWTGTQAVNINLASFVWAFGGFTTPFFGTTTLPVSFPSAVDLYTQMAIIDGANVDGVSLSQPNGLHISTGVTLLAGPTTDDGVVLVTAGVPGQCMPAIPFYTNTYTQYSVCSNGRVMFQPAGALAPFTADFSPTVAEGLGETFAGFWLDFQPGSAGSGTIDITTPAPGIMSVVYNNQHYWGNPAILVSGSITFDTTTGAVILSGMAGWPNFPVTAGTFNVTFMGMSPGPLGSLAGAATDGGASPYSLGGFGGPIGGPADMLYAFGNPLNLSGGANSIAFVPNGAGNYTWAGF